MAEVVFRFAVEDASAVRFGVSATHELLRAIGVLQEPGRAPLQAAWLRSVRSRVPAGALETVEAVVRPGSYVPDFLTPDVIGCSTVEDEFAQVRAASERDVMEDLIRCPANDIAQQRRLQTWLEEPRQAIAQISSAWWTLWQTMLAPQWSQLRFALDRDIDHRSRMQSRVGVGAMFESLHERVSWHSGELRIRTDVWSEVVEGSGRGIVLVPSVFGWPRCSVITVRRRDPALFYPVRDVSYAWPDARRAQETALERLLGASRAEILQKLESPCSTAQVAEACRLGRPTASHHLTILREAGLISTQREGKSVRHELTGLGRALLHGN